MGGRDWFKAARFAGLVAAALGLLAVILAPFIGDVLFPSFKWQVEPLAYIGVVVVICGLAAAVGLGALAHRRTGRGPRGDATRTWSRVTQDYFEMFGHDMGRPFRRIVGKEREVRARLDESGRAVDPAVLDLLDEIEQQAPSFRLMISNVRVLVELEDAEPPPRRDPVDPAQVVRNVVDRYRGPAADGGAELTWWCDPAEFGLVYSDAGAIDHIVTNLIDNAVRFAESHVEVSLTRGPDRLFIRVRDDGAGIPASHRPHVFDRGWTPEVAGGRERVSSGLGLFIARELAGRCGGELIVDGKTEPNEDHHTSFTLALPNRPSAEALER